MIHIPRGAILAALLSLAATTSGAAERDEVRTPVPVVQAGRMDVASRAGHVDVPIAVTRDWTRTQSDITRAVIIIHGWPRRDLRAGENAERVGGDAARGSVVITPQFLTARDVTAHGLGTDVLNWGENDWQKGEPSNGEAAVSSFAVVDEVFRRLSDRAIFPNLRTIVLAGHSAGGQFVQRYAIVGRGQDNLDPSRVHVRYVVANPASYLYFTDDRPARGDEGFERVDFAACPLAHRWPYSLQNDVPAYARPLAPVPDLQARYLHRDIIYLLGGSDDDPHADGSDLTCAAESEGETRLRRGLAYNAYAQMLDPGVSNSAVVVPGVGHKSYAMFASPPGIQALFK